MTPSALSTFVALGCLVGGCSSEPAPSQGRASLVRRGPEQVEVVPAAGQPPLCLVYTLTEGGPIRLLTMTPERMSIPCPEGAPVAGTVFRIPAREGPVRVLVVFSDQPLGADTTARQIDECVSAKRPVTGMDLRAPGKVLVETLAFTPGG